MEYETYRFEVCDRIVLSGMDIDQIHDLPISDMAPSVYVQPGKMFQSNVHSYDCFKHLEKTFNVGFQWCKRINSFMNCASNESYNMFVPGKEGKKMWKKCVEVL